MHSTAPAGSPSKCCVGMLGPQTLCLCPNFVSRAGLLSAAEKAEWLRHNPSPLIRAFRQLAETPLGGRILFDAVVKSAAGALQPS